MPLPEEVVTSVASTNFKSLGDGPAFFQNLAMQNAVNQQNLGATNAIQLQQAGGTVLVAAVGKIVKALTEADAEEAASLKEVLSGGDNAVGIMEALSALAAGQVATKTAQTTPPPTATCAARDAVSSSSNVSRTRSATATGSVR